MKEKYCELLFGFDCGSVAETQSEQAIKAFKKFISAQKKLDKYSILSTIGDINFIKGSVNESPASFMSSSAISRTSFTSLDAATSSADFCSFS